MLRPNAVDGMAAELVSVLGADRQVRPFSKRPQGCEPLKAGEIVPTGALTEAMPLRAGQRWRAAFEGVGFDRVGLAVG